MKTKLKLSSILIVFATLVLSFSSCDEKEVLPPVTVTEASGLKVDSVSYEYAKLSWEGTVGVYQVLISVGEELVKDTVVSVDTLGVFLKPGTTFSWKVAMVNLGVKSDFIEGPNFTTSAVVNPSGLNAKNITHNSAILSWVGYEDEYYHVEVSSIDSLTVDSLVLGTSLKLADLLPETTYSWEVTLVLPAYTSETVFGVDFTTLEDVLTIEDVVGIYNISAISQWDGELTEEGIIIEKASDSDTLLIKNLLETGTLVKGVLDAATRTITLDDGQLLLSDVDFGADGIGDIYFVNADDNAPVIFNVPSVGEIISPLQQWGYYVDPLGWYDKYTESIWTKVEASGVKAKTAKSKSKKTHSIKQGGISK